MICNFVNIQSRLTEREPRDQIISGLFSIPRLFNLRLSRIVVKENSNISVALKSSFVVVVGVITQWNFPFSTPLENTAHFDGGNTVVFKPASNRHLIAMKIVEILERAGLPKEF
jgi:acyl-CoA reductase-like NAD-dependent aldehyde dehydrogenase